MFDNKYKVGTGLYTVQCTGKYQVDNYNKGSIVGFKKKYILCSKGLLRHVPWVSKKSTR